MSEETGVAEVLRTLERLARDADERAETHDADGFPRYAEVARFRADVLRRAGEQYRKGPVLRDDRGRCLACGDHDGVACHACGNGLDALPAIRAESDRPHGQKHRTEGRPA